MARKSEIKPRQSQAQLMEALATAADKQRRQLEELNEYVGYLESVLRKVLETNGYNPNTLKPSPHQSQQKGE